MNQRAFEKHVNSRKHGERIRNNNSQQRRQQQTNSMERNYTNPTNEINETKPTDIQSILRNWNSLVEVANSIKLEAVHLLQRTNGRISMETQIITMLKNYIRIFDSNVNMYQFGSTCYGFGGRNTNLNFWIDTSKL